MSIISKILFALIVVNGTIMLSLTLKVRGILIKLGEKDSYLFVSFISDLFQLRKISKATDGKYDKLILHSFCILFLEIFLILLMIILL